jgi:hypothetical protein
VNYRIEYLEEVFDQLGKIPKNMRQTIIKAMKSWGPILIDLSLLFAISEDFSECVSAITESFIEWKRKKSPF